MKVKPRAEDFLRKSRREEVVGCLFMIGGIMKKGGVARNP